MEEKERYYCYKILRDCVMPEVLFEIKDRKCNKWNLIIEDKRNVDKIIKKLNQQDKEIKLLVELYDELNKKYCKQQDELTNLKEVNRQLKQQLEATKEQLTNLTDNFEDDENFSAYENTKRFIEDTTALLEYLVSFSDKLGIAHNFLALEQYIYSLPKKIVEEIKEHCDFCENCNEWIISEKKIDIILDKILKKYGGEYEN